jgi:putative PIG3 family NAD(P)H quinone oxidoreductase
MGRAVNTWQERLVLGQDYASDKAMIAIEISTYGSPDVLRPVERPKPTAAAGEVLIEVEASGVSRADVFQRKGKYPPPAGASDIPGLDVAGVIAAVGSGVGEWQVGDRVCALLTGGGYAESCVAQAVQVLPIPEGWTAVEAATLPENLFTVYDNLITRARLQEAETVLIHGGTSGIGSTAIMLARAIGAIPYATAGSDEKRRACEEIGAEQAINYKTEDFVEAVQRITANRGVDVIADIVGGAYLERNIEALALEGRLSLIATLGGAVGTLPIGKLMSKRGTIVGSTMRARTPVQKGEIADRLRRHVWPLLPEKKTIRPLVDSTFPLAEAAMAHKRMESGDHIGKIVLTREMS